MTLYFFQTVSMNAQYYQMLLENNLGKKELKLNILYAFISLLLENILHIVII